MSSSSLRNGFEMFKMQESLWLRPYKCVLEIRGKENRLKQGSRALAERGRDQGSREATWGHSLCKLRGHGSSCGVFRENEGAIPTMERRFFFYRL